MVKTVTSINNNTITFDTDKYIIDKLKTTTICDSSDSTGSSGDSIVADGNGGWSWGPQTGGGGSGVPAGGSGDVIISDGSSGLESTNILNVNPTDGIITGTCTLTVVGGVGISENLNVGGNVELESSLGVALPAAPDRQIFEDREHFGRDLALSRDGKTIAVGTPHDHSGGYKAGAIYVYTRTDLSQVWQPKGSAIIGVPSGIWPSSEFGHQLGRGVSISDDGNTVVGGIALDVQVTVAKFSNGSWTTTTFYPSQLVYSDGDYPDIHLNASGNILLITSSSNSYLGTQAHGSAWVYEYNGSNWIQKGATIHGNTQHGGDKLGAAEFGPGTASLSKDGLTFSLGRNKVEDNFKGEIVVYDWNGTSWAPRTPITGTVNGEQHMINDLSDDGNTILVSGRSASQIARVYDWNGTSWVQKGGDLIMPTWQAFFAISGDSNTLLFGNPSSSAGFVDVYRYTSNSWTLSKTIQQVGPTFGMALSITPDGNNFAASDFISKTVYTYGLPGTDYGNAGDVLTCNASGLPEWSNDVVDKSTDQNIGGFKNFSNFMGIAIGTTQSDWPLRIGSSGLGISGSLYFYAHGADLNGATGNYGGAYWTSQETNLIGLYVDEGIRAGRLFIMSDRRIKKDIVDIQDDEALNKLRVLQPKKYKYIDPVRGTHEVYGFIAQEVAEVIPYSVSLENSYLPSHMIFCKIIDTTVNTSTIDTGVSHTLIVNDFICFRDNKYNLIEGAKVIEIIDDKTIKVDRIFNKEDTVYTTTTGETVNDVIYLYGKKIDDFHTLNKDTIWTVATAALQEVDRQLQAEKSKTSDLISRLEALEARLEILESK